MDNLRILVVDDKKIAGDNFGFMLGSGGHDITVLQDADEALKRIKRENFDVVFMDIVMPNRDGVEALEIIKQVKPELPVIMMTGYTVEEKRNRIRDLGAVACLDKPVDLGEIRELVKSAVGKVI